MAAYVGTSGNDNLTGTSGADTFDMSQGGSDTVSGGGGNDVISFGATFDATDVVDGGTGTNTLNLTGDYSLPLVFSATNIANIQTITLGHGFSYDLIMNDANVAAGQTLAVNASLLGIDQLFHFDGTAETDGNFNITDGYGDDVILTGAGNDTINISHGGEDRVNGGLGDDIITAGAAFDDGDRIDGGTSTAASNNILRLTGDYSEGVIFDSNTIHNIQNLQLGAGYNYNFTVNPATFTTGRQIIVNGANLGAGNWLDFDGSTSGAAFHLIGGAGNDVLIGGPGTNTFDISDGGTDIATGGAATDSFLAGGALTPDDQLTGGGGADSLSLTSLGTSPFVMEATTIVDISILKLGAGSSYDIVMNDANLTSGFVMTVQGQGLGAADTLVFDGSAETDGSFIIRGGAANDTLIGGAGDDAINLKFGGNDIAKGNGGDDTIAAGSAFTAADSVDGGAGNDTLELTGDYSAGLVFGAATMVNVETLLLDAGFSYNLTMNDANVAVGQTLTVNASALGAANSLTLDASAETDGYYVVEGGAGNDDIKLGVLTAGDQISGGAGNDTLELNGDTNLTFSAATMTGINTLVLDAGHNYTLVLQDANLTKPLTVDASALDASHALTITNGSTVAAGFAETGGAGNDTFIFGTNLRATDTIDGGGGTNTVQLAGSNTIVFGADTFANVENLVLTGAGATDNLTLNDSDMAGIASFTIDASAIAGATTIVDASATTAAAIDILGGSGTSAITLTHGGGIDTVTGGSGNDTITVNGVLTAADSINGGAGTNELVLNGDYSGGLTLGASTVLNFQTLKLDAGNSYDLVTNDATVASGQTLTVNATALAAANSLTFDGSAETNGHFVLEGGAGNDYFKFAAFTSGDEVFGGAGNDTVELNADSNLSFTSSNLTGVEKFLLDAGHNYTLNFADSSLGSALTVDGSALDASHALNITNGSAAAVTATETGGADNDIFIFGSNFTAADAINGGAGNDTVELTGSCSVTFGDSTLQNVEAITIVAPSGFGVSALSDNLTLDNADMAGLTTFKVDGSAMSSFEAQTGSTLTVNGSAVTTTSLDLIGANTSGDALTGSTSTLIGGGGNDTLNGTDTFNGTFTGNGGQDTIMLPYLGDDPQISATQSVVIGYNAVSDSTGVNRDIVSNVEFTYYNIEFNRAATGDVFHVSGVTGGAVTAIDATVTSGSLSTATFDTDLAAAIGSGQLGAHHAVLFDPNAGDLSGHMFLIVDANGTAGYQAGADLVIEVSSSYLGALSTANFT